ncbi:uncharacterized protein LOC123688812 isoform X14 [Harmonia axyridis]|uniref:uncharacterized protein LOC123688812 isoform X14 n=1 Tax=Harmonia axyridis TaxID=115357 RepID=UPI001E279652|nr:uncharacterized protein LOC123688812 isoform X14 [Harmonia axyridis]
MDESNSSNDKGNNGPGNNDNDPTQGNRMGHPGSAKANENQNVAEPTGDNSLSDDTWRVEAINNVRTTVSPVRRISFSSTQQTGSCSTIRSLLIGSKRPSSSTEGHPGPAKAPQPGPSSMSRPGASSMSQPGPSSMSQPGPSSMSQPGPSSMPQPGPSSMFQPGPSSMSQPGPSQPSQEDQEGASANPMLGAPLHVDVSMQYYRHMDVEEQIIAEVGDLALRIRRNTLQIANNPVSRGIIPLALSPLIDLGLFRIVFPEVEGPSYFFLLQDNQRTIQDESRPVRRRFDPRKEELMRFGYAEHIPTEVESFGHLIMPLDFSDGSYIHALGGIPLDIEPGTEMRIDPSSKLVPSDMQRRNPMLSDILGLKKANIKIQMNDPILTAMLGSPPLNFYHILKIFAQFYIARERTLARARMLCLQEAHSIVRKVQPKLAIEWAEIDDLMYSEEEQRNLAMKRRKIMQRVIQVVKPFRPYLVNIWNIINPTLEFLEVSSRLIETPPKQIPTGPVNFMVYHVTTDHAVPSGSTSGTTTQGTQEEQETAAANEEEERESEETPSEVPGQVQAQNTGETQSSGTGGEIPEAEVSEQVQERNTTETEDSETVQEEQTAETESEFRARVQEENVEETETQSSAAACQTMEIAAVDPETGSIEVVSTRQYMGERFEAVIQADVPRESPPRLTELAERVVPTSPSITPTETSEYTGPRPLFHVPPIPPVRNNSNRPRTLQDLVQPPSISATIQRNVPRKTPPRSTKLAERVVPTSPSITPTETSEYIAPKPLFQTPRIPPVRNTSTTITSLLDLVPTPSISVTVQGFGPQMSQPRSNYVIKLHFPLPRFGPERSSSRVDYFCGDFPQDYGMTLNKRHPRRRETAPDRLLDFSNDMERNRDNQPAPQDTASSPSNTQSNTVHTSGNPPPKETSGTGTTQSGSSSAPQTGGTSPRGASSGGSTQTGRGSGSGSRIGTFSPQQSSSQRGRRTQRRTTPRETDNSSETDSQPEQPSVAPRRSPRLEALQQATPDRSPRRVTRSSSSRLEGTGSQTQSQGDSASEPNTQTSTGTSSVSGTSGAESSGVITQSQGDSASEQNTQTSTGASSVSGTSGAESSGVITQSQGDSTSQPNTQTSTGTSSVSGTSGAESSGVITQSQGDSASEQNTQTSTGASSVSGTSGAESSGVITQSQGDSTSQPNTQTSTGTSSVSGTSGAESSGVITQSQGDSTSQPNTQTFTGTSSVSGTSGAESSGVITRSQGDSSSEPNTQTSTGTSSVSGTSGAESSGVITRSQGDSASEPNTQTSTGTSSVSGTSGAESSGVITRSQGDSASEPNTQTSTGTSSVSGTSGAESSRVITSLSIIPTASGSAPLSSPLKRRTAETADDLLRKRMKDNISSQAGPSNPVDINMEEEDELMEIVVEDTSQEQESEGISNEPGTAQVDQQLSAAGESLQLSPPWTPVIEMLYEQGLTLLHIEEQYFNHGQPRRPEGAVQTGEPRQPGAEQQTVLPRRPEAEVLMVQPTRPETEEQTAEPRRPDAEESTDQPGTSETEQQTEQPRSSEGQQQSEQTGGQESNQTAQRPPNEVLYPVLLQRLSAPPPPQRRPDQRVPTSNYRLRNYVEYDLNIEQVMDQPAASEVDQPAASEAQTSSLQPTSDHPLAEIPPESSPSAKNDQDTGARQQDVRNPAPGPSSEDVTNISTPRPDEPISYEQGLGLLQNEEQRLNQGQPGRKKTVLQTGEPENEQQTVHPRRPEAEELMVEPRRPEAELLTGEPREPEAEQQTLQPRRAEAEELMVEPRRPENEQLTVEQRRLEAELVTGEPREPEDEQQTVQPRRPVAEELMVEPRRPETEQLTVQQRISEIELITGQIRRPEGEQQTVQPREPEAEQRTVQPTTPGTEEQMAEPRRQQQPTLQQRRPEGEQLTAQTRMPEGEQQTEEPRRQQHPTVQHRRPEAEERRAIQMIPDPELLMLLYHLEAPELEGLGAALFQNMVEKAKEILVTEAIEYGYWPSLPEQVKAKVKPSLWPVNKLKKPEQNAASRNLPQGTSRTSVDTSPVHPQNVYTSPSSGTSRQVDQQHSRRSSAGSAPMKISPQQQQLSRSSSAGSAPMKISPQQQQLSRSSSAGSTPMKISPQQQQLSRSSSAGSTPMDISPQQQQLSRPSSAGSTPMDISPQRQQLSRPSSAGSTPMDISPQRQQLSRPSSAGSTPMKISPQQQQLSRSSSAGSIPMEISPQQQQLPETPQCASGTYMDTSACHLGHHTHPNESATDTSPITKSWYKTTSGRCVKRFQGTPRTAVVRSLFNQPGTSEMSPPRLMLESQPGPSRMDQPGPSGMSQPGPSRIDQPGPSGMSQPGASRMDQPGPSGMSQPGPSRIDQPGPSGISQPGLSRMDQPGPSGMSQPGPSRINQPGPSGISQPGPSRPRCDTPMPVDEDSDSDDEIDVKRLSPAEPRCNSFTVKKAKNQEMSKARRRPHSLPKEAIIIPPPDQLANISLPFVRNVPLTTQVKDEALPRRLAQSLARTKPWKEPKRRRLENDQPTILTTPSPAWESTDPSEPPLHQPSGSVPGIGLVDADPRTTLRRARESTSSDSSSSQTEPMNLVVFQSPSPNFPVKRQKPNRPSSSPGQCTDQGGQQGSGGSRETQLHQAGPSRMQTPPRPTQTQISPPIAHQTKLDFHPAGPSRRTQTSRKRSRSETSLPKADQSGPSGTQTSGNGYFLDHASPIAYRLQYLFERAGYGMQVAQLKSQIERYYGSRVYLELHRRGYGLPQQQPIIPISEVPILSHLDGPSGNQTSRKRTLSQTNLGSGSSSISHSQSQLHQAGSGMQTPQQQQRQNTPGSGSSRGSHSQLHQAGSGMQTPQQQQRQNTPGSGGSRRSNSQSELHQAGSGMHTPQQHQRQNTTGSGGSRRSHSQSELHQAESGMQTPQQQQRQNTPGSGGSRRAHSQSELHQAGSRMQTPQQQQRQNTPGSGGSRRAHSQSELHQAGSRMQTPQQQQRQNTPGSGGSRRAHSQSELHQAGSRMQIPQQQQRQNTPGSGGSRRSYSLSELLQDESGMQTPQQQQRQNTPDSGGSRRSYSLSELLQDESGMQTPQQQQRQNTPGSGGSRRSYSLSELLQDESGMQTPQQQQRQNTPGSGGSRRAHSQSELHQAGSGMQTPPQRQRQNTPGSGGSRRAHSQSELHQAGSGMQTPQQQQRQNTPGSGGSRRSHSQSQLHQGGSGMQTPQQQQRQNTPGSGGSMRYHSQSQLHQAGSSMQTTQLQSQIPNIPISVQPIISQTQSQLHQAGQRGTQTTQRRSRSPINRGSGRSHSLSQSQQARSEMQTTQLQSPTQNIPISVQPIVSRTQPQAGTSGIQTSQRPSQMQTNPGSGRSRGSHSQSQFHQAGSEMPQLQPQVQNIPGSGRSRGSYSQSQFHQAGSEMPQLQPQVQNIPGSGRSRGSHSQSQFHQAGSEMPQLQPQVQNIPGSGRSRGSHSQSQFHQAGSEMPQLQPQVQNIPGSGRSRGSHSQSQFHQAGSEMPQLQPQVQNIPGSGRSRGSHSQSQFHQTGSEMPQLQPQVQNIPISGQPIISQTQPQLHQAGPSGLQTTYTPSQTNTNPRLRTISGVRNVVDLARQFQQHTQFEDSQCSGASAISQPQFDDLLARRIIRHYAQIQYSQGTTVRTSSQSYQPPLDSCSSQMISDRSTDNQRTQPSSQIHHIPSSDEARTSQPATILCVTGRAECICTGKGVLLAFEPRPDLQSSFPASRTTEERSLNFICRNPVSDESIYLDPPVFIWTDDGEAEVTFIGSVEYETLENSCQPGAASSGATTSGASTSGASTSGASTSGASTSGAEILNQNSDVGGTSGTEGYPETHGMENRRWNSILVDIYSDVSNASLDEHCLDGSSRIQRHAFDSSPSRYGPEQRSQSDSHPYPLLERERILSQLQFLPRLRQKQASEGSSLPSNSPIPQPYESTENQETQLLSQIQPTQAPEVSLEPQPDPRSTQIQSEEHEAHIRMLSRLRYLSVDSQGQYPGMPLSAQTYSQSSQYQSGALSENQSTQLLPQIQQTNPGVPLRSETNPQSSQYQSVALSANQSIQLLPQIQTNPAGVPLGTQTYPQSSKYQSGALSENQSMQLPPQIQQTTGPEGMESFLPVMTSNADEALYEILGTWSTEHSAIPQPDLHQVQSSQSSSGTSEYQGTESTTKLHNPITGKLKRFNPFSHRSQGSSGPSEGQRRQSRLEREEIPPSGGSSTSKYDHLHQPVPGQAEPVSLLERLLSQPRDTASEEEGYQLYRRLHLQQPQSHISGLGASQITPSLSQTQPIPGAEEPMISQPQTHQLEYQTGPIESQMTQSQSQVQHGGAAEEPLYHHFSVFDTEETENSLVHILIEVPQASSSRRNLEVPLCPPQYYYVGSEGTMNIFLKTMPHNPADRRSSLPQVNQESWRQQTDSEPCTSRSRAYSEPSDPQDKYKIVGRGRLSKKKISDLKLNEIRCQFCNAFFKIHDKPEHERSCDNKENPGNF